MARNILIDIDEFETELRTRIQESEEWEVQDLFAIGETGFYELTYPGIDKIVEPAMEILENHFFDQNKTATKENCSNVNLRS